MTCEHVENLRDYRGKLLLCTQCVKMFCEACAAKHEHQTLPPQAPITVVQP